MFKITQINVDERTITFMLPIANIVNKTVPWLERVEEENAMCVMLSASSIEHLLTYSLNRLYGVSFSNIEFFRYTFSEDAEAILSSMTEEYCRYATDLFNELYSQERIHQNLISGGILNES